VRAGDVRAVSRAITAIENRDPHAEELLAQLFSLTGRAFLIGVTGGPGSGKSTLVDRLGAKYRVEGRTVGVIAVDPTSPFTGGAILGDRIRMQGHAGDSGMFIRSMATRGALGGLARATADAALVLDAAGKQIVLIETVGVGQDEIDIARLTDCTIVLVVPGMGDDVQSMKAGLMEAADIFVLNKAEREGADQLEQQLHAALEASPRSWQPPVIRTTATTGEGVEALTAAIEKFRARLNTSGEGRARAAAQWQRRLLAMLEEELLESVVTASGGKQALEAIAAEVAQRKRSPYDAVRALMTNNTPAGTERR
jgi:LAO/AO transport system kinase